jgi:hypothetical protein
MIVIFCNLIIGLKKLNTVIFSNSIITHLSYSISPISSNLIIIIYKYFVPEFYSWWISIVERKIISVNYKKVFGKFKVNSFIFLKLNYFIFLKLLHNIFNENNLIISTFSLHGFRWWIVNLFSFSPFL